MPTQQPENTGLSDRAVATVASNKDSGDRIFHGYSVSVRGEMPSDITETVTTAHVKALAWISDHMSGESEADRPRDKLEQDGV